MRRGDDCGDEGDTVKQRRAYTYPEQLRPVIDDDGVRRFERIPNHPTRPARATDVSTWLEEVPDEEPDQK